MKRVTDFLLGIVLLIIVSPVVLLVSTVVFVSLGWPIFFTQTRPGLGGKSFRLLKFRTMSNQVDAAGNLLPDAERLSRVGLFLRCYSLDELPELLNIVKGEMSLVGPRPLLMEYLPLYNESQRRRHELKPGLTGWAQVRGRNALSWQEKFDLDVWYVDHRGFWLDLKIILLTAIQVLRPRGINMDGHTTMPKFRGDEQP